MADLVKMWTPDTGYSFNEGEYTYTVIGSQQLNAKATSKDKTSYFSVQESFNLNGVLYTVTSMDECYRGCVNLTSVPSIPASVTSMNYCFEGCTQLADDIEVNNNPTSYESIFDGTTSSIFIVDNTTNNSSNWQTIAQSYGNVHYEATDNQAPQLGVLQVVRGKYELDSDNNWKWTEDDSGDDIRVTLNATLFTDLLPKSWRSNIYIERFYVEINNTEILPGVDSEQYIVDSSSYTEVSGVRKYKSPLVLYILDYESSGVLKINVTDNYNHQSSTATETVYNLFVMLDFFPGGQGMAIGKASARNGLDIKIPTTIGEGLMPPTITNSNEIDLDNYQLIIGKYNLQKNSADFIVGGGSENSRRNSFEIDNGGLYSYDNDNIPVMQIETSSNARGTEAYTALDISSSNYSFDITNENLISGETIHFVINYTTRTVSYQITSDETAVSGKTYYELIDGSYVIVQDIAEDANPKTLGYYEEIITTETATQSGNVTESVSRDLQVNDVTIGSIDFTISTNKITVTIDRTDSLERKLDVTIEYLILTPNYISYNFGKYLNNSRQLQFTMGQYNDNKNSNLLEIGNGTDNNNRKNVLAVTEAGHLEITGALRPANNTQRNKISYIQGARGDNALIYSPHTTIDDSWTPTLVQQTEGHGSWQLGCFSTEQLQFVYATKDNIDSQTDTVKVIGFNSDGGISIPKDSYLRLGVGAIHQGTYNTDNIYYEIPGYHSFYVDGKGIMYIHKDKITISSGIDLRVTSINGSALGALAKKSSVNTATAWVEGYANSPAVDGNSNFSVTVHYSTSNRVVGVARVTLSNYNGEGSGSVVLRGFDLNNIDTGTIETYWRNTSATARSAGAFRVYVQIITIPNTYS